MMVPNAGNELLCTERFVSVVESEKIRKKLQKGVDKKVVLWYNIIVLGNEHQKDKVCS